MTEDMTLRLPPEVRGKYQESCSRMTPTALNLRFGLTDLSRDEEEEGPRVPRTTASQEAARVAKRALQAWTHIHQAHWSSVADPTADKATAFLRSAQFAEQQLGLVDQMYERTMAMIEEKAKHLQSVLGNARKPPTGQGDAAIDAEVRAMIRAASSDPNKAMQIASAHPRAVASLPAGIGAELVGEASYRSLVRTHLKAVEPEALADQDDLMAALRQLTTATTALEKEANGLIDFNTARQMQSHGKWQPPTGGDSE